jgi:hypothetical protein
MQVFHGVPVHERERVFLPVLQRYYPNITIISDVTNQLNRLKKSTHAKGRFPLGGIFRA